MVIEDSSENSAVPDWEAEEPWVQRSMQMSERSFALVVRKDWKRVRVLESEFVP